MIGNQTFSGNIYIFHSFDVGEEIELEKVKESQKVIIKPFNSPKYFKNYHIPISIDLPHPHTAAGNKCVSCKIHNFGAISLTYKIPFNDTLENIRATLADIEAQYLEESVIDVGSVFKVIKPYVVKPNFFLARSSYLTTHVYPQPEKIDITKFKQEYSGVIASMVRFETETLSEYQKNEIMDDAIGYFRGDLIIIDPESAFVYDDEYEDIIDLFEFANIQLMELQYFDVILDQQLTLTYEGKSKRLPLKAYLPFIRTPWKGPIADLQQLRVDISVISERLESSIKFIGEAYFVEVYELLVEKLDIRGWKNSINKKLDIVSDIRSVYQHKMDAIREDLLSILIIILIFIELMVAILKQPTLQH